MDNAGRCGKIRVHADPEIQDLIPGFLENRSKDLREIRLSLQAGNWEKIRTIGHIMKGAGSGYGFSEISEIGALIESAAKAGNMQEIEKQARRLADYLIRLEVIYD